MVVSRIAKSIFLIISLLIISGVFFTLIKNNKKADDKFYALHFKGIIVNKTYLENKKALFVKVDNDWYGVMHYLLERYIEKGDSLIKNESSNCMIVKRDSSIVSTDTFCNSFAYIETEKKII